MDIKVNESIRSIKEGRTLYEVRDRFKKLADVIILNGFPQKKDKIIKEGDSIVLIKKGEKLSREEFDVLTKARHTAGVFKKVKDIKIGIAGVGGLGSNIAMSLVRLGVYNLVICDYDVVEPSNLNRQEYFIEDIGKYKVDALDDNLRRINPYINVKKYIKKIDETNIDEIFNDVDIIVEAFDEPEYKAMLCNYILENMENKVLVAASGMAGYYSSNSITTRKIRKGFYICGDLKNEAKEGVGLMSPRVSICANHMANMILRIILGKEEC